MSVAAAWIQPRKQLKRCDTDFFSLANSDASQTQSNRLAQYDGGFASRNANAHHGDSGNEQDDLGHGFNYFLSVRPPLT